MADIQYKGLNWANRETRFLKFLASPDRRTGTPMELELVHAPITKAPVYSALSYCWGAATELASVVIDGSRVLIRENLCDALLHCGMQAGDHIWADALCIDQKYTPEKNYQLGLMGQIYANSSRTIVWLGAAGPQTGLASSYLKVCGRIARNAESKTYGGYYANHNYIFQEAMRELEHVEEAREGLFELLTRPYWGRIWIIQEIAKSRRVSVKCGNHQFDLEILLFLVATTLESIPLRAKCLLRAIGSFRMQIQGDKPYHARFSLFTALLHTRFSSSTEPLDKVYALLGITKDGTDLIPDPSYADSEEDLMHRLSAKFLCSRETNNAMLVARQPRSILHDRISLPPWVIRPAALHKLPSWLTEASRGNRSHVDWSFNAQTSTLHTHATKLGRPFGANVRYGSRAIEYAATEAERSSLVGQYLSHLLRRFATGTNIRASLREGNPLTDAFARMIRDAEKGSTTYSAQYDLDSSRSTLKDIGGIPILGKDLDDWAFNFISRRMEQERNRQYGRNPSSQPIKIPTFAFQTIRDSLDGLLCLEGRRLKLAVIKEVQPVVVPPQTRLLEHEIFQVNQCHLPVVMERDSRSGQYVVIGEACFGKNRDGSWWSARQVLEEMPPGKERSQMITINLDRK